MRGERGWHAPLKRESRRLNLSTRFTPPLDLSTVAPLQPTPILQPNPILAPSPPRPPAMPLKAAQPREPKVVDARASRMVDCGRCRAASALRHSRKRQGVVQQCRAVQGEYLQSPIVLLSIKPTKHPSKPTMTKILIFTINPSPVAREGAAVCAHGGSALVRVEPVRVALVRSAPVEGPHLRLLSDHSLQLGEWCLGVDLF